MINYVIINGVNSNTINGLGINELPPISKPPMRVLTETIDGRDGDITTNLGYNAYDKTFTIGLFGTGYDINDIIAFFNNEGTIVFSNEPDKYYKYKIIEQIDYEKLLEFKTASVRLHCQPFKYPLEEEPLEIEYEYVNGEGESITLDNTEEDIKMSIDPKGNTKQNSTLGNNLIDTSGATTQTINDVTFTPTYNSKGELESIKVNGTASAMNSYIFPNYVTLKAGTYYISKQTSNNVHLLIVDSNGSSYVSTSDTEKSFTLSEDKSVRLWLRVYSGTSINNAVLYPMVAKTSEAAYEPYTNGASPNPSYPQEIHSVTGDNEIVVCGKNLFDAAKVVKGRLDNDGIIVVPTRTSELTTNNGIITFTTTAAYGGFTSPLIPITPNTNYIFSVGNTTIQTFTIRFSYYDEKQNQVSQEYQYSTNTKIINKNAYYFRFSVEASSAITNGSISNIQLEKNNEKTPYELYTEQIFPLYLGVIGKNLLNKDKIERGRSYNYGTTGQVPTYQNDNKRGSLSPQNAIRVKPNTKYTLSIQSGFGFSIAQMESDLKSLGDTGWITFQTSYTITTSATTEFIGFNFRKDNNGEFSDADWETFINGTIMFELGESASTFEPYKPFELNAIGNYKDGFARNTGKNLFDVSAITENTYLAGNGGTGTSSVTNISDYIEIDSSTDYTLSYDYTTLLNGNYRGRCFYDDNKTYISGNEHNPANKVQTFTTPSGAKYIRFAYDKNCSNIQLEKGSQTTYEPYGTGQWCKYNAIGKYITDGTETQWNYYTTSSKPVFYLDTTNYFDYLQQANLICYSNNFQGKGQVTSFDNVYDLGNNVITFRTSLSRLVIRDDSQTSISDFKTWLGTNNTAIYYVLAAPYLSLIEDNNLIEQLDNIQNAVSEKGQTNILQNNNDLPFYLIASAMKQNTNEVTVNNIGNIYAKPTLDIEGSGIINIYKDNNQILQLNMDDTNEIVFEDMNAYDPATNELKNRKVTGNYNNVTIPSGESIIKVDGNLTKMTITNYTRWL